MKILILGAGKMGSFFSDLLSFNNKVAVLETDVRKLRFMYNVLRFTDYKPEKNDNELMQELEITLTKEE